MLTSKQLLVDTLKQEYEDGTIEYSCYSILIDPEDDTQIDEDNMKVNFGIILLVDNSAKVPVYDGAYGWCNVVASVPNLKRCNESHDHYWFNQGNERDYAQKYWQDHVYLCKSENLKHSDPQSQMLHSYEDSGWNYIGYVLN